MVLAPILGLGGKMTKATKIGQVFMIQEGTMIPIGRGVLKIHFNKTQTKPEKNLEVDKKDKKDKLKKP
tara:strand:+ start:698 stop:901 length:204 start_codon:yes stop_codon:yes gene_type:complete